MREKLSSRWALVIFAVVAFVTAAVLGVLASDRDTESETERQTTQPIVDAAATFPVPPGSEPAFPDTAEVEPLTAVRGWQAQGSLDDACTSWRESFRSWIDDDGVGSVQGEVTPGQSCMFSGRKGDYSVALLVSVYGEDPPQVTLTLTG